MKTNTTESALSRRDFMKLGAVTTIVASLAALGISISSTEKPLDPEKNLADFKKLMDLIYNSRDKETLYDRAKLLTGFVKYNFKLPSGYSAAISILTSSAKEVIRIEEDNINITYPYDSQEKITDDPNSYLKQARLDLDSDDIIEFEAYIEYPQTQYKGLKLTLMGDNSPTTIGHIDSVEVYTNEPGISPTLLYNKMINICINYKNQQFGDTIQKTIGNDPNHPAGFFLLKPNQIVQNLTERDYQDILTQTNIK